MRRIININKDWYFSKEAAVVPKTLPIDWQIVSIPHTWNNLDEQDGGNDYIKTAA